MLQCKSAKIGITASGVPNLEKWYSCLDCSVKGERAAEHRDVALIYPDYVCARLQLLRSHVDKSLQMLAQAVDQQWCLLSVTGPSTSEWKLQ